MYLDFKVKTPLSRKGVTRKTIKGVTYIYYTYSRAYDPAKKYTTPKSTSIGKCDSSDIETMYPNANYLKFFPEAELPAEKVASRSCCLRVGAVMVIRKIIENYHLEKLLGSIIGTDAGLFMDLAAYAIVTENNAGQYYPEYAYNHPLFTKDMKIYSDTKVSKFVNSLTRDQSIQFLNEWNEQHDHRQRIYISYDPTNKNCQAGDLELVEYGHPKVDTGKPVVNYAVGYDTSNQVPLFYEEYPGSITDVSQLQFMVDRVADYGYKHIGFILDRGYFSKENIHYMDRCGYEFIMMVKGLKKLVSGLVLDVKGSFEEKHECCIRDHKVYGTTVKRQLFPSDKQDRYFHIYFNGHKCAGERDRLEAKIADMEDYLHKHENQRIPLGKAFKDYFNLTYYHQGQADETFLYAKPRTDAINHELKLCGYFVLITSEQMTADAALDLYKGRDVSEKLFRGDKSYLGFHSFRVHSDESLHGKIFIEFIALIIRNRLYSLLKARMKQSGKKANYMTVPAALRELEKIELIRTSDGGYRLGHAVTATQKEILMAFNMKAMDVKAEASAVATALMASTQKGA